MMTVIVIDGLEENLFNIKVRVGDGYAANNYIIAYEAEFVLSWLADM